MCKLLVIVLLSIVANVFAEDPNVKVSVYYESLCPDSIRFITQQLAPSYDYVKNYITVDFVPYGKASHTQVDGTWQFTCQHGPRECYGNLMQACALAETDNQQTQVEFVNCVMGSSNPSDDSDISFCAESYGISWSNIVECASNGVGYDLLAQLGDRTHSVTPTITFVPTIIYNDVYNSQLQSNSLVDFLNTVCGVIGDDVCKVAK